ncbi:MAG: leucine-rich repeat protein, partial [Acutalibacteraceae bacterium]
MKNALKRSLSVILSMLLIFTIIPVGTVNVLAATAVSDLGIELGTDAGITRAEWLHNLVVVFNMTVEDDALPDNYFSDLTEEHEYYSDIILAVEFGVVNVEAGGKLCPDDYVTRDFAASTLNFCLGYQLEEGAEYTFTDYESCSSPDSAQIAVDRGWLKLSGGCFEPTTLVTSAETETMFTDAANILEEAVVDTEYNSTYDFADDVIVVEKDTVVSEDENGVVSITDCPVTISVGDKFAVYHEEIPCVYVAETVTVENGITKITTSIVEAEEAYTDVDAQGQADADAMEIIPADDVEISFEEEANPVATFASGTKTIKTINVKKTITLTNAAKATVSVKIKNPVVEYSVNKSYVYVALNGTTEINYGIKMDMLTATGSSKQITLFTCNVAGVGSFDVNVNLSCEGSASGNVTGYLTAGIECVKGDHIRAVKGFTQSQYYTNVEATANVGLRASLGVTHLPFVDASIYAEVGANARISSTTYSGTELPKKCTHFSAYMYALYGAYASVDFGVWSKTFSKSYEIFGYSNSPVRIVHHYEDGMPVPKCTRGTSYENFFTNGYSHWSGSGWLGANGAYGLYGDGTYFPLYNYTLDENNNATITKYNGNSWSVYIPEDIDGYTVTAIGEDAFRSKSARYICIPDTVTRIEQYAFSNCYNLSNITIPDTVAFIGSYAFDECISLSDITIPSNLEIINTGVFYGCSSLRNVTIPDSVTEIGSSAFSNCINLKD